MPTLTNERPLTNRGERQLGALRNLADSPKLRPWGSQSGLRMSYSPARSGPPLSFPWPLGFMLVLPTMMIATFVKAPATICQVLTCIFSFQLNSCRREALLPILQMRNLRLREGKRLHINFWCNWNFNPSFLSLDPVFFTTPPYKTQVLGQSQTLS